MKHILVREETDLVEWSNELMKDRELENMRETNREVKETDKNIQAENKNSLDDSIHALASKSNTNDTYKEQNRKTNREQEIQTEKNYITVTVWDLTEKERLDSLRKQIQRYGRIVDAQVVEKRVRRAIVFKVALWNEEWKTRLINTWSVEIGEGRLGRLSIGGMDTEMLKKREKFRATIRNVPNRAMESLLLRQLKRTHAKNVHIRRNSNGN